MKDRPSSPEEDDPNDPDFVPDAKPKGSKRRQIADSDEDEETKAKQSGNDNNKITQAASKVGNDGGEATDSEENSDKGGTSSPKKKKRRRKRKKSMVDDLKSDLKSQTPAPDRKAVLESKHKRKEAEEKARLEDEEKRKRIRKQAHDEFLKEKKMKEKDKKIFYEEQAKIIATKYIDPQKKGTKKLKKKDINDGIAAAFNYNRLGYGSMTDREWQRYNEWKDKWASRNEWYRQIIQQNEHLSNDIVELKYDPEKRQYIGRYIKEGREEVEGGGLDQYETVEEMSLDFLNDILHPVFVELVKMYKGMFLKIPLGESRPDYVKSGEKRFLRTFI